MLSTKEGRCLERDDPRDGGQCRESVGDESDTENREQASVGKL